MAISVRKVETRTDDKVFFEFPWKIYKDDPNWVPPLKSMRKETLSREKNPAWEYLEGDYYIAWRGDEPVGTIAAFVNKRHNEFQHENIAWFGFFESIDDQEVADALLKTAEDWAKSHGYDALRGPQSFTAHEEVGVLIDGFERPVLLMPYHHAYYQKLIDTYGGLQKVMDVSSYRLDYDPVAFTKSRDYEVMQKIVARIQRQGNFTVRSVNKKTQVADFGLVKEIYNDAWAANWGFTPMTDRELDALIEGLAAFFDPRLSAIVEADGVPAGFMLGVADLNIALQRAYPRPGVPELMTLAKVLWHWKLRPKVNGYRIPLMGVREQFRNKGLEMMMIKHFFDNAMGVDQPYRQVDAGWILETNHDMIGVLERANLYPYRTYRLYEKAL
ncbi:MAG: GNAT family N-acetyltransferase [Aggregatilineales bacterium]